MAVLGRVAFGVLAGVGMAALLACRAIIGSLDDCNISADCAPKGSGLTCVDHLCVVGKGAGQDADLPDTVSPIDSAVADAGSDAIGGTLPPNGDFESSGGGCGPGWESVNSTIERDSNARSGQSACKVCRLGNPGMVQSAPKGIAAGPGAYRLGAWVKVSAPDAGIAELTINFMSMKDGVATGGIPKQFIPAATYQLIEVDLTAGPDTDGLGVQIANPGGTVGSCFFVDDITMVRR